MNGSAQAGGSGLLPASERLARAVLTRITEPGDLALAHVVSEHGAATVLEALRDGSLAEAHGAPSPRRIAGYAARLPIVDPARELELAALAGIRVVCPGEPEWPAQLDDLARAGASAGVGEERLTAPLALWVRGEQDLRLASLRSVAVIGARAATAYGEHVAAGLGAALAERGWTVVSGAAYGVDAAAHRGALAVGGTTMAVLACGVDVVYPRGHDRLVRRIAESGVVVSELPPGAVVTRSRLLQRNRLVAALTRGTVVVEAAVRSGTATTARQAGQLGRVVMAVPGPVTSAASVGCHELIRAAKALLVTDANDVEDAVGRIGEAPSAPRRGEERPEDGLDAATLRLLDALPARKAVGLAALARSAGLDLAQTRASLGLLVALGLAEPDAGGYRVSGALRQRRARGRPDAPAGGVGA